jgi:tyrosine-protein phosphatase YwqE
MFAAFRSLFNKQVSSPCSGLAVDMHSHVLPGLDDGADSLEQSLEMVARFMHLGYRKLIMTPHIMGDFYKNTPGNIRQKLALLQAAVQEKGWQISLECAAEYYLDEWFLGKVTAPEPLLTFGDQYVLFETSYINEPLNFREAVFTLKSAGYKPVLAHPERYTYLYGRFEDLLRIRESGVLFQLNLNSLTGYYSDTARRVAEKLVDQKLVDFVGSDAHHSRHLHTLTKTAASTYFKKVLDLPLQNYHL